MIPMTIKLTDDVQKSIPNVVKRVVDILAKIKTTDTQVTT
jgi:hypothetical protein